MVTDPIIPTLVLVEGESDAAAVRAVAELMGCELGSHHIQICPAGGVTNFPRALEAFLRQHPGAGICGLYDSAEERHVRRALTQAAIPIATHQSLAVFGFYACVADLEDELIRALGSEAVEQVLASQDELHSFRRFQAMPQHRSTSVQQQLRRFLGTRATRKIRSAQSLVQALDCSRLPQPLADLADRLREAASASLRRLDA
jgi:hypothetical protein